MKKKVFTICLSLLGIFPAFSQSTDDTYWEVVLPHATSGTDLPAAQWGAMNCTENGDGSTAPYFDCDYIIRDSKGDENIRFTADKKVAINMASNVTPDAELHVNGEIKANVVNAGEIFTHKWKIRAADYVFEPDYKLPKLSDVENYVKEHKHLPEIPSGKEMQENGLDIGTMNMLLLKKVEELVLYNIAQEKRLEKQAERIHKLEELVNQ